MSPTRGAAPPGVAALSRRGFASLNPLSRVHGATGRSAFTLLFGSRGWFFPLGRHFTSSQAALNSLLLVFSAPSFLRATGAGQAHWQRRRRGFWV